MTNADQAYPSIQIQCKDRLREFCLNLGAFRALESHLRAKTSDEEFSILEDFDWSDNSIENLCLITWAGLYTDSLQDKEPFTIEHAEKVVSLVGLVEMRQCIEESLSRVMSKEQYAKMKEDVEKKRERRGQKAKSKNQGRR